MYQMENLSFRTLKFLLPAFLLLFAKPILAADIDPFIGSYSGSAEVESGGVTNHRDMSVEIAETDDGFEITWKSITHKADGRIKEKEYHIGFLPTQRDGIFTAAMATNVFGNPVPLDPMKGDPYVWSRITGNIFTVYSLLIDQDGGYEMQEYNRTLTEGGLNLEYLRIRNGEKLKNIRSFLKKK
jgi:hypothetical protein